MAKDKDKGKVERVRIALDSVSSRNLPEVILRSMTTRDLEKIKVIARETQKPTTSSEPAKGNEAAPRQSTEPKKE